MVANYVCTKIFLYTKGTKGGSKELKELLTFMENPIYDNAVDKELSEILNIVDTVKMNPEERGRYMGLMGVTDYERRDANEEGQIQGSIKTCKFMNTDRETAKEAIITQFSLTEEKAEEYLNLYW